MINISNNLHMHATVNEIMQRLHKYSHLDTRTCTHTHTCTHTQIVCAYTGTKHTRSTWIYLICHLIEGHTLACRRKEDVGKEGGKKIDTDNKKCIGNIHEATLYVNWSKAMHILAQTPNLQISFGDSLACRGNGEVGGGKTRKLHCLSYAGLIKYSRKSA